MNFIWKEKKAQYASGESLYINRIRVGEYGWNSYRAKDGGDKNDYCGTVLLPSLKTKTVYGEDIASVKTRIESIVSSWFKEALAEGN